MLLRLSELHFQNWASVAKGAGDSAGGRRIGRPSEGTMGYYGCTRVTIAQWVNTVARVFPRPRARGTALDFIGVLDMFLYSGSA